MYFLSYSDVGSIINTGLYNNKDGLAGQLL